jgi:AcrR family transcriptional regulator
MPGTSGAKRGGDDLPIELRRLWGLPQPSTLGRPAELDVARVVHAAIDIADRKGLAAVTLPAIAKTLGYTTMALYRHIGSKDELLVLMRDAAIGAPPAISTPSRNWRGGLRQWAAAERRLYERRPWLARLPVSGPPAGPRQIAWIDAALHVLRGTALDWGQKVGGLLLVSGYVRNAALLAEDLERGRLKSGIAKAEAERRYGRSLARLVDPARFPEAARLFASGLFETPPAARRRDAASDADFVFGLECILDGISVAIARSGRQGPDFSRATSSVVCSD